MLYSGCITVLLSRLGQLCLVKSLYHRGLEGRKGLYSLSAFVLSVSSLLDALLLVNILASCSDIVQSIQQELKNQFLMHFHIIQITHVAT